MDNTIYPIYTFPREPSPCLKISFAIVLILLTLYSVPNLYLEFSFIYECIKAKETLYLTLILILSTMTIMGLIWMHLACWCTNNVLPCPNAVNRLILLITLIFMTIALIIIFTVVAIQTKNIWSALIHPFVIHSF